MAHDVKPDKIEALAAQGLTMEQIAYSLGMGESTLYEWKKNKPEVSEAIKRGRAKGVATVTNALFQSAKGGNTTAQIFYLKNRDPSEWKDRKEHELTGRDGGPIETKAEWTVLPVTPLKDDPENPEG